MTAAPGIGSGGEQSGSGERSPKRPVGVSLPPMPPITPMRRGGVSAPAIVLGIALLLTAAATGYVANATEARERIRFAAQVHELRDALSSRFETYTSLLRGTTGLFAADNDVSLADFHAYVDRLDLERHYPGIRALGFGRQVAPADIPALTARIQSQGMPEFHVWPPAPPNTPDQIPVLALEPQSATSTRVVGFDMLSDDIRRAAIERARDEGVPAATSKLTFAPATDVNKVPGLLLILPIYRGGSIPQTVAERRSSFFGCVYEGFRAENLMQSVLSDGEGGHRLSVRLYDGDALRPDALLYASPPVTSPPRLRSGHLTATEHLSIAGRTWTMTFEPASGFADDATDLTNLTLISGLGISGLLFWIALALEAARDTAEATAERLRRSEESLLEQEIRQRAFFRDVLGSVTEGRLRLCDSAADLPKFLEPEAEIALAVDSLRDFRAAVRTLAEKAQLPPERVHDLVTAVGEASMNAVVHAGGGRGSVARTHGGDAVQVRIEDSGTGIDVDHLPRATLERGYTTAGSLGHGFFLMLNSVDRIWLLTGPMGTTVVLEQESKPADPSWLAAKMGSPI